MDFTKLSIHPSSTDYLIATALFYKHGKIYVCCAKLLQPCPTLCDSLDCSPPGSLSVAFSRQEYWSGLPCPPPGDLLETGIKPTSLMFPARQVGSLHQHHLLYPDNHDGVLTHLEPDILECEVKWALGSITTNKASGGDRIPAELLQILKDDSVKVLHSMCQQTWNTQQ